MKTNSKFSVEEIKSFVSNINKCQSGLACVTITEPRLRAPKSCPFAGRVKKVTLYVGFNFMSYANTINGSAARISGATSDYQAATPAYAHHVAGLENVLLQSNKDCEQYYLALTSKKCYLHMKATYLLDGHVATPEQMAEITTWLYQDRKPCAKQMEHGIDPDQEVWRLLPKLENVKCLTDKEAEAQEVYDTLTAE